MQLPIVFANNEQNLKSLPKKAHDPSSAAWRTQSGQKAEHIWRDKYN